MGDVIVEDAPTQMPTRRKPIPSSIPNFEAFDGISADGGDEYTTLKKLQRELEYIHPGQRHREVEGGLLIDVRYINLQEEYIKDEQR